MKTETIEYKDGDVTLRGYLAYDEKKCKRPGVLVMPEAFGLGEHAKKRAERLAELGYVAFAGDPYGKRNRSGNPARGDETCNTSIWDECLIVSRHSRRPTPADGRDWILHGHVLARTRSRRTQGIVSFHGGLQTQCPRKWQR